MKKNTLYYIYREREIISIIFFSSKLSKLLSSSFWTLPYFTQINISIIRYIAACSNSVRPFACPYIVMTLTIRATGKSAKCSWLWPIFTWEIYRPRIQTETKKNWPSTISSAKHVNTNADIGGHAVVDSMSCLFVKLIFFEIIFLLWF